MRKPVVPMAQQFLVVAPAMVREPMVYREEGRDCFDPVSPQRMLPRLSQRAAKRGRLGRAQQPRRSRRAVSGGGSCLRTNRTGVVNTRA